MSYRVIVYRTNDKGEELCYCCSRRFGNLLIAQHFAVRQNKKHNRIARISKVV